MKCLLRSALGLLVLGWVVAATSATAGRDVTLPHPAEAAEDVHFWVRIYSEVPTSGGLIHDSRHLGVVYDRITVPKGLSRRARERHTEKAKSKYRKILDSLAGGKRGGLSSEEKRVLGLWPAGTSNAEFRKARSRLRFQLGQSDKFRAGVIRSGRWKKMIERVFEEHDLPPELTSLPHVESSFTPWAYSRVGAAGLWQFTRSTGRRFLRVDHVADERLDPFRATIAAARLLKQNRQVTGSWPLAITAYNHGAAGMRRAARKLGTRDIVTITRKYKSRTFGFASRNFYYELLAAAEVARNHERYFGKLTFDTPIDYETFEVPFYTTPGALAKALGVERTTLETANPALRPTVWRGAKYIPRRFGLRVPRAQLGRPVEAGLEAIPRSKRFAEQTRDLDYRVRRGDALSTIARRFKVSVSELVAINGLRSRHRIRVGQKLKLPDRGGVVRTRRSQQAAVTADIPASGRYTVRRGDTISRIAKRFNVSEAEILSANRLRNRNRIYVGQSLVLRGVEPIVAEIAENDAKPIVEKKHHPDAVATLSNPPDRPAESLLPVQGAALIETAAANQIAEEGTPSDLPGLLADPSDYGVASDKTIEVQGAETLGHFAEWLDIRASRLRRVNGLSYGRSIAIGQRIKLDLSRIDAAVFEARRQEYHRNLQEAFFERYEIEGTRTHVTRRGDSVWTLAEKKYRVPLWLLRQYNPDINFAALQKGMRVQVPILQERDNWTPSTKVADQRAS
ncbi:MAG: LysM peptidoglycan-binding domain-containing protein [Myxococcota bacterium]|jgi:membrane-bound lytic murein transglycosylase D|nr:LysM peptidoglycan-binding domain-containing protein [Myxococcota bacterium]